MKRAECQGIPLREKCICMVRLNRELDVISLENLTLAVGATLRAGNVRRHTALTLGAGLELRGTPAIGSAAHFLLHFGYSTFWNGHGSA